MLNYEAEVVALVSAVNMLRRILLPLLLALPAVAQQPSARVLLFSATAEYRHDSIPTAVEELQARAASIDVVFEHTEDRARFNDEYLATYDAVIFLSTTGEVLDSSGKAALQAYLNKGGNFIGIHAACASLRNATFFIRELGAEFDYHPELQETALSVIGPAHPSTAGLPSPWRIRDEMYNFKSDPRSVGATVVLTVDESSYTDPGPRRFDHGSPHPIAWFQNQGAGVEEGGIAGRSFYTSLGHLNETWQDSTFLSHVLGGISWALRSNTTRAFNSTALVGNPDRTPNERSTSLTSSSAQATVTSSSGDSGSGPSESDSNNAQKARISSIQQYVLTFAAVAFTQRLLMRSLHNS